MELKSNKKAEAFSIENETLATAREKLDRGLEGEPLRQAYRELCEEYEKLLDEAKFLTKVSDKLESKLNTANEQLRVHNESLAHEAENERSRGQKILEKNKQLYQEKSELDFKMNKFQLTLIVLIALLVAFCLVLVYWVFFRPPTL